ncbi:MAG TPA: hypothetical protein VEU96_28870 [Bryobacteraceae bacterium]|nr:hypothetical protein [Bryobacteraceae bacterium]
MRHLLALVVLSSSLFAQTARDQARRADLIFVSTKLPQLHVNFFFQLSPADFNQAVAALDAQVPTLTDAEFYIGLAKLVAMAGDEQTAITLDDAVAAKAGFQQFPLQFRWLDDGLFVTATAADYSRALGARLARVGDSSVDDVLRQLATVIPHSNSQRVRYMAQSYLRSPQILQGLDLIPVATTTPLTFQTLAGEEFTLDIGATGTPLLTAPAADQGQIPLYLQNSTLNYWFTYSPPLRLLYFKYNQCADIPGNPFINVANNILNTLDTNPVDTLVVDLRGNTGGDPNLIELLTSGLIARIPTFIASPNFRAYAVIDKGTFSAAMADAMLFKTPADEYQPVIPGFDPEKIIRIIGEPTGGAPSHFGQVAGFVLPSSKLTGHYSTQFVDAPPFIAPDYDPDGPSFGPDIQVPFRSSDYFARHDPVLAAIVARWEGAPQKPSGGVFTVNGASFRVEQGLAPGSFASGFGSFPPSVDQVLVNGAAAPITSAGSSQVNFVIPASVPPGRATVSVRAGSSEAATGQATITAAGPGIFVVQSTNPAQPGAVLNQDSSLNSNTNRAARASVLQIFATGYGPLDSSQQAAARVLISGVPADVLFSGPIAQFPGLWQINARVPQGVTGQVSLFVIAGYTASNGVTVWVE